MFLAYSEDDEDGGLLRSGRRFWLGKRRRIATWRERDRERCSAIGRGDGKLVPQIYEESCDEEEGYQLIYGDEEEV